MWHGKKHVQKNVCNIVINARECKKDPSNKKVILISFLEMIILFIGVISIAFVFISSFNIYVSKKVISSSGFLLSLLVEIIMINKNINKYILGLFAFLVLLLSYIFRNNIFRGFKATVDKVFSKLEDSSSYEVFTFRFNNIYNKMDINIFFILVLIILTCVITIVMIQSYNIVLASLVAVISGINIVYLYIFPSTISLVGLIFFLVALVAIDIDYQEMKGKKVIINFLEYSTKVKVGVSLGIFIIIIFIVMLIVYPIKKYERAEYLNSIRDKLENVCNDMSFSNFISDNSGIASGGIDGGSLGTVDTLSYKNKVDLKVVLPEGFLGENGIETYLKGFVGGKYTGNSWKSIDDEELDNKKNEGINYEVLNNIFNNDYNKLMIAKAKMTVENIDANDKYLYLPYNSKSTSNDTSSYSCDYYINNSELEDGVMNSKYDDYTEYVHKVYTELPENKLKEIKKKYKNYYEKSSYSLDQCIKKVKSDIWKDTKYDLSPGKLPKGEDFVEYFLYKNKKGYCSHYASAATVILRAMGIPARYVEGYLISDFEYMYSMNPYLDGIERIGYSDKKEDIKTIYSELEVKDSNAHAWVEVYKDNIGWVPMEVTPGVTTDEVAVNNTVKEFKASNENKNLQNISINYKYIFYFFIIAIVTLLIVIIIIKKVVKKNKKNFSYRQEIIDNYKNILRIFNYLGNDEEIFESYLVYAKSIEKKYDFIFQGDFIYITQLVMKVQYDKNPIEKEEALDSKNFYKYLSTIIYTILPNIEKIKFKYLKKLI